MSTAKSKSQSLGRKRGLFLLSIMFALLVVVTFSGQGPQAQASGFVTVGSFATSTEDCSSAEGQAACEAIDDCIFFGGECELEDSDQDGIPNSLDNCPYISNENQANDDVGPTSAIASSQYGSSTHTFPDEECDPTSEGFEDPNACAVDVLDQEDTPDDNCNPFTGNSHAFFFEDGGEGQEVFPDFTSTDWVKANFGGEGSVLASDIDIWESNGIDEESGGFVTRVDVLNPAGDVTTVWRADIDGDDPTPCGGNLHIDLGGILDVKSVIVYLDTKNVGGAYVEGGSVGQSSFGVGGDTSLFEQIDYISLSTDSVGDACSGTGLSYSDHNTITKFGFNLLDEGAVDDSAVVTLIGDTVIETIAIGNSEGGGEEDDIEMVQYDGIGRLTSEGGNLDLDFKNIRIRESFTRESIGENGVDLLKFDSFFDVFFEIELTDPLGNKDPLVLENRGEGGVRIEAQFDLDNDWPPGLPPELECYKFIPETFNVVCSSIECETSQECFDQGCSGGCGEGEGECQGEGPQDVPIPIPLFDRDGGESPIYEIFELIHCFVPDEPPQFPDEPTIPEFTQTLSYDALGQVHFDLGTGEGGEDRLITLEGPVIVRLDPESPGEGSQFIETEILSMELTGNHPDLGQMTIRLGAGEGEGEGGEIEIPLSEGTPDFPADSFFDVFFEIELDGNAYSNDVISPQAKITSIPWQPTCHQVIFEEPVEFSPNYEEIPDSIFLHQFTFCPISDQEFGEDFDGDGISDDIDNCPGDVFCPGRINDVRCRDLSQDECLAEDSYQITGEGEGAAVSCYFGVRTDNQGEGPNTIGCAACGEQNQLLRDQHDDKGCENECEPVCANNPIYLDQGCDSIVGEGEGAADRCDSAFTIDSGELISCVFIFGECNPCEGGECDQCSQTSFNPPPECFNGDTCIDLGAGDTCIDGVCTVQADSDGDGFGNQCDPCPFDEDNDADGDGLCASSDICPSDPTNDIDDDGFCNGEGFEEEEKDGDNDNCPFTFNPPPVCENNADCEAVGAGTCYEEESHCSQQADTDGDGLGDACDNQVLFSEVSPVLDGVISPGEYDDATRVDHFFDLDSEGQGQVVIYETYDGPFLYLAFDVLFDELAYFNDFVEVILDPFPEIDEETGELLCDPAISLEYFVPFGEQEEVDFGVPQSRLGGDAEVVYGFSSSPNSATEHRIFEFKFDRAALFFDEERMIYHDPICKNFSGADEETRDEWFFPEIETFKQMSLVPGPEFIPLWTELVDGDGEHEFNIPDYGSITTGLSMNVDIGDVDLDGDTELVQGWAISSEGEGEQVALRVVDAQTGTIKWEEDELGETEGVSRVGHGIFQRSVEPPENCIDGKDNEAACDDIGGCIFTPDEEPEESGDGVCDPDEELFELFPGVVSDVLDEGVIVIWDAVNGDLVTSFDTDCDAEIDDITDMVVTDTNGDGISEIIYSCPDEDGIGLFSGINEEAFGVSDEPDEGSISEFVASADFNDDSFLDFAYVTIGNGGSDNCVGIISGSFGEGGGEKLIQDLCEFKTGGPAIDLIEVPGRGTCIVTGNTNGFVAVYCEEIPNDEEFNENSVGSQNGEGFDLTFEFITDIELDGEVLDVNVQGDTIFALTTGDFEFEDTLYALAILEEGEEGFDDLEKLWQRPHSPPLDWFNIYVGLDLIAANANDVAVVGADKTLYDYDHDGNLIASAFLKIIPDMLLKGFLADGSEILVVVGEQIEDIGKKFVFTTSVITETQEDGSCIVNLFDPITDELIGFLDTCDPSPDLTEKEIEFIPGSLLKITGVEGVIKTVRFPGALPSTSAPLCVKDSDDLVSLTIGDTCTDAGELKFTTCPQTLGGITCTPDETGAPTFFPMQNSGVSSGKGPAPSGGGGGGGGDGDGGGSGGFGGGGGFSGTRAAPSCAEVWTCTAFSSCTLTGSQTRSCVDTANCGTQQIRPELIRDCTYSPPISCSDAIQNQDETDTDCGGDTCPRCLISQTCVVDTDCASQLCESGVCAAKPAIAPPQPIIKPQIEIIEEIQEVIEQQRFPLIIIILMIIAILIGLIAWKPELLAPIAKDSTGSINEKTSEENDSEDDDDSDTKDDDSDTKDDDDSNTKDESKLDTKDEDDSDNKDEDDLDWDKLDDEDDDLGDKDKK